jgi:hypothetical protein
MLTTDESSEFSQRTKNLKKWEMGGYEVDVTPGWTVIAQHWSVPYIHEIIKIERELDHPICGYPTKSGTPCRCFPAEIEGESIEDVGRCKTHKQKNIPKPPQPAFVSHSEVIEDKERWLAASPVFQSLRGYAQDMWSNCNACELRDVCDKFNAGNSCSIEQDLFEDVVGGLVIDNRLETTIDQMMAFDITMKFVNMIKTFLYEKKYGMIRSLQDGITGLRMRLSTQIMQLASKLAIDRKTRLVIKQDGISTLANKDLSQILSNMEDIVSVKSVTATEIIKGPPPPRDMKFIDLDGNEIIEGDFSVEFE